MNTRPDREQPQPCTVRELSTLVPGLLLTELTDGDAAAYYAVIDRNRDHLSRYGDYQDEAKATPAWVTDHLAQSAPDRFGIRLNRLLIGRVDLLHAAPPQFGLGYWLSHDATGHGYATAACAAVIRHAQASHDATDVFAGVTHGNRPSIDLLRRLGFEPTARFDRHTRFHLPLNPRHRSSTGMDNSST